MTASIEHGTLQRQGWARVLIGLGVVLGALAWLFRVSLGSMVETWSGSETYAHGFLILPISLWLIWEKRGLLATLSPRPTLLPVLAMLPVGLIWLVAALVDVNVVQQYSALTLLVLATWSMLGNAIARSLAFPLGFLFLAVPVGEGLTYPLMNFTADFTVGALQLTGVPVYRDGTFFSIPSGDWSVVEECSGIRYVLASVTLGLLYAYLTYSKLWKRLLFVAASLLVPVLANGVRAYMIVMIGHLSGMKLATGVDHLIYGWVFFGLVIAIMFAVGAIWRDPESDAVPIRVQPKNGARLPVVMAALLLGGAIWPVALTALKAGTAGAVQPVAVRSPLPQGSWQAESRNLWDWRPTVFGTDGEYYSYYRSGADPVGLYLGVYRHQREGAEVVSVRNQMAPSNHPGWSDKEITRRQIPTPDGVLEVVQNRLVARGTGARLLVWNWYRIGHVDTGNPYLAKLLEAVYRLGGGAPSAVLIAVAAPYQQDVDEAARVLASFIAEMWPSIGQELGRALASEPRS